MSLTVSSGVNLVLDRYVVPIQNRGAVLVTDHPSPE